MTLTILTSEWSENLVIFYLELEKITFLNFRPEALQNYLKKMALRLGGKLKELRIHLCQTSNQSQGVR